MSESDVYDPSFPTEDDVAGSSTDTTREMLEVIARGGIDFQSSDDMRSTPGSKKKKKKKKKKKTDVIASFEVDVEPPHLFPDDQEPPVPSEQEIMEFDGQWPPWQGGQFSPKGRTPRQRPFVQRGSWGRGNRGGNGSKFMNMQQPFRGQNFSGRGGRFQHPTQFNPQEDNTEFMGSLYPDFDSNIHNNMGGPGTPHNNRGGPRPPPHMGGPQSSPHTFQDRMHDGKRGQPSLLGDGPMQFRMGQRFGGEHQFGPGEGPRNFGPHHREQFPGFHGDSHMQHHEEMIGYDSNSPLPHQQFEDRSHAPEHNPHHSQVNKPDFAKGMPPLPLDFKLPDFAKQQEELLQELSKAPGPPTGPTSETTTESVIPDALDHIPMPPPPQKSSAPQPQPPPPPPPPQAQPQPRLPELVVPQPPLPQEPASLPLPQQPTIPQPPLPQQPSILPSQPPAVLPWQINNHATPSLPQTHPEVPLLPQTQPHPVAPPLPHPVAPLPQTLILAQSSPHMHPVAPPMQQSSQVGTMPPTTFITEEPAKQQVDTEPSDTQTCIPNVEPSPIQMDISPSTIEDNINETNPQQSSEGNPADSSDTQTLHAIDPIKSTAMKLLEKFQMKKKAESQTQENEGGNPQGKKGLINLRSGLRPGTQKSKVSLSSSSRIQFALKNSAKVTGQSNPLKIRSSIGDDEDDVKPEESNKESSDGSPSLSIVKEKSLKSEQTVSHNPSLNEKETDFGHKTKETSNDKEIVVVKTTEPRSNQGSHDNHDRSSSPKSKDLSGSWARSKDYRKKTRSPEVERKTRNSDSRRKNREYRGRSKSPESIDRKSRFSRRRQSTDEEGSPDSVDRNRKNRSRGHVEKSRSKTPDARPDSSDSRKSKTTKDHERSLSPESRSRKDSYSEKVKNKHSGESVHRSSRERSEERRSKRSSRLKERSQRSSSASDTEEKYVQKSKRKESIEREKRGKSEDERLHGTESSNDENKSSHKNIISEQKTDRNASKRGKSEENEERNLHHQYVSDSRHGKDSSEGRQGNSEVIVKKDDKEVNEGSSSPIITLEIRSKWDDKENSETGEACQKHEDDEISHWKPSPDYNREREKSEEALMHRKRDVKGCYDERPRRHSLDRERDYQKVSGRSEDLDRDKTRKVDESQQDEHRLVKKDKRQISPDREEPRRRRSRRHQSSPEQTESNRKSRWSRGGENKNQEDEHSVKNPLVSYDSPMKEVVPLVSYDSPMKGAVPLVSYDSPKTISPVPSSIVKLRPLVQYDSEDDSDTDSGNKDTKVCNESETTKKTGVSEQRISMEVDNIQSAENSKCVTAIIETSGKIPNSISGEVTNMETDRTLPVVGVTKGADAEKESENNQTFPSVSNKIIQAYEDFEKFLNETSFDSKTVVSETSETDKNSTVTEPEITKDNSCRSANESEIHLANDSKTTDTFDVKSISDTSGGVSTSSAGLDRETSGTQLKKPETVMPDNTLEEKSGRRSLRSRRSHTSESQESSPRESRRSKRMSKEEKVSNEAVTPEAGRMTRSRRLRSLDDSEAVEDQSTGKRTEITEEGKTGRRKTRSQHSVDESRDSSRETRSSKRSRRHRNPSGSSSDHEKEDKSLKSPKEIHSDKKLSSPLSVDLSSIALPGEGIKIRIFSDIHSPDKKGEKTGEKQKTELENCDQEVPPAVIDLDSIVLPPEPSKPPEATKQLLTEPTPEEPPPPPPPPPVAMETESVKESDVAIDKPAMPEAAKVEDKNKKFIGVKNEKLRAAMEKLQAEKNADNAEVKEEKVKEIKEQPGKISLSFGRRLTRGRVLKTPSVLTDDDSETRQLIKFGLPKVIAPLKTVPTWEVDENSKELKSDPREKCDSVLPKSDLLVKCDNVVPKPEAKLGQNIPKADSFVMYESESTKIQSDESETKQTGIKIEVKGIRTRSKFKDLPETGTASKPEPIVRQRSWRKSSKSQIFETEDASNSSSIGSDVGTGSDVCTGSDFKQAVDELPSSDGDTRIPHIEEGSPEIEKGSPEKVEETSGADSSLSGQVKLDLVSESTPAIKHSAQQDIVRHHTQVDDEIFFKNIPMPSPPNAVIDNEGTNYENQDMDLDEDSETEMEPEPEVVAKSEENSEKGFIKEDKSSQKENPNVTKDNATYIQSESRILNLSGIKDIVLPDEHLESENRASHTNTTKEALSMNKDTTLSSLKDIALPCENKGPLGSESRASYQDTTKESLSVNKEKIFSSLKDIALPGENKGPMCVESTPAQIEGTKDIFGVNKDVVDSSETNLTYKLPSQNVDVPTGFSAESKSSEEKKREPVSIKPFTIGRKSEKIIVNIKTIIESPIKETPDIPNDKNSLTQTRQNKDVTQSVPSLDDKMPEVTSNVTLEDGKRPTDNKGKAREGTLDSTRCDQEVRPQSIISSPGGIPMEIISEEAIKLRKVSFIGRELMTQADPKPSMTIEADSVSATQNDPAVLELAQVAESEKEDSDKTMSGTLLTDKVLCSIPLPDMELPSQEKDKKDLMEEGEILSESEGDKSLEEKGNECGEQGIGTVITRFSEEPPNKIQVICAADKPAKSRTRWSAIETVVSNVPDPVTVPAAAEMAEGNIALKTSEPVVMAPGNSSQALTEEESWSQESIQQIQGRLTMDPNSNRFMERDYDQFQAGKDQFEDRYPDHYRGKREHDRFNETEISQDGGDGKDQGWYEGRDWNSEHYDDRERPRIDKRYKHSRDYDDYERYDRHGSSRSGDRDRTPERRRERNRMRDRSRERDRTPDRNRDRDRTPDRNRDRDRTPERIRDRDRTPNRSRRDRTPERSRDADRSSERRRARSRDRSRDRERDRNRRYRERDDHHHRRRSKHSRDRSRDRTRDRSRDRTRDRSRDRTRDQSRDRTRDRSRELSRDRDKRTHRDYEEDRSSKRDREKEKDHDDKSSKGKKDKVDNSWLEAKLTGKDSTIPTSNQSSDYVQSMYNVFFQKTSSSTSTGTTISQTNAAEYYQNYPDYQQHGTVGGAAAEGMYPTTGNQTPKMHQLPSQPAEMSVFGGQYQQTIPNQHGFQQFPGQVPLSGATPQGLIGKGIPPQGIPGQGPRPQGIPSRGPQPQGIPAQGPQPQGIPVQGPATLHTGPPTGLQSQGIPANGLQSQTTQALQPQPVDVGRNIAPHIPGQLPPSILLPQNPGPSALPLQPGMGNPSYIDPQQHMYSSQTATYPPKGLPSTIPPSPGSQGAPPIQRLYPEEVAPPTPVPNIPDARYTTPVSTSGFIQASPNTTQHIHGQESTTAPLQRMFGKKIQVSSSFNLDSKPVVSSTAKMLPAPFPKAPQSQSLLKDTQEPTASSTTSPMPRKKLGKSSPRSHLFSKMSMQEDIKQVPTSSEEKVSEVTTSPEESTPPQQSSSPALPTSSVTDFPSSINVPHGVPIKLGIKQELQARKEMEQAMTSPPASSRPFKVKSRWLRFSELETPLPPPSSPGDSNLPTSTSSEGTNQKSEQACDSEQREERETIQPKRDVQVKREPYDAWDPASDLVISPTVNQKTDKSSKKESKKKEKEKDKPAQAPAPAPVPVQAPAPVPAEIKIKEKKEEEAEEEAEEEDENKPPYFDLIEDNIYLGERKKSKKMKEVRRMLCDCTASVEDREMGLIACGEDCLNRMLYIECGSRCQCGEYCTNKRIQKKQYSDVEPFRTSWKGFGLKTNEELIPGQFVMEYVGEVLDYRQFKSRTKQYAKTAQQHYYFMALNADEVIDATSRGNISRFINHSCDPNCETQKWTVNGALRVGFYARKHVEANEELTFDYQFELYGKEAQKCFCGTEKCRGFIGSTKNTPVTKGRKREEEVEEEEKKTKQELFEDELEQELEEMTSQGLMSTENVLTLCRLMVRAEDAEHRLTLLNVLQVTTERNCLRLFLDYHGLELLWTWIVDLRDDAPDVKMQILSTLKILPITNKTILKDSKILAIIQKLAEKDNSEESSSHVISSTPPIGQVTPSTPPISSKEKPTSILSITTAKESKSGKKKVKFALEDASSSDNESRTSNSDSFSDLVGNDLYTDFDSPPSTESSKKRVLRSSKKDGVSVLCRQVIDKQDPLAQATDSEVSESCAASNSQEEKITQEPKIDSTENDDKLSSEKNSAIKCMDSETTVTAADSSDGKSETPTDKVAADSSSSSSSSSEMELNLSKDEEEKDNVTECDSSEPKDDVVSLAEDLLQHWSDLKEIFRIPKKEQVEERKRIERQLLDVRPTKQRQREKFERLQDQTRIRAAGWDSGIRKRKRPPPPPPPTEEDEDPSKPRKTLLPSPPKMTKEQRRQRFEADVKAHDEMVAEHQRQQEELFLQQQQQLLSDPTYLFFQQTLVQHGYGLEVAQLHIQALLQEGHTPDAIVSQLAAQLQQGLQQGLQQQGLQQGLQQQGLQQGLQQQGLQQQEGGIEPGFQDPALQQLLNPDYQAQQQAQQQALLQSGMTFMEDGQAQQQHQQLMYQQQQQGQFPSQADLVAQQQTQGLTPAQVLSSGAQQTLAFQQQQQQQPQPMEQQAAQMSSDPQSIAFMQQMADPSTRIQHLQQQLQIQSQLAVLAQGAAPTEEEDVPPPPSPPKAKQTKLPPNWKSAKDSDGKTYYYHTITRQTQWDTPTWDCTQDDSMDMCTPPMEEVKPVKKNSKQTTTAAADTSSELAKKIKDQFRNKMSSYVVVCLNPYRKPDCKMGHISSTEDFKHLARKLTHHVMAKELKHCHHVEDLEVNENVKAKAKDYVKKYMGKFGSMYRKTGSPDD